MGRKAHWTKEDLVRLFEILFENGSSITSDPSFRDLLTRNENLFSNQITREANGNIAYRSVDFDCIDMTDEDFWKEMDCTEHGDFIEDNAAAAMLKMAEKLNLLN
jgi:hypothetical protein